MSTTSDLVAAREQAARKLAALREAEQAMRDAREDFDKARRVVARFKARHTRAGVTK